MNGLVYPREVIEKALARYNRLIAEGRAFGPVIDGTITLSRVGFLVEKATLEGDDVVISVRTLDNDPGQMANALLRQGRELVLCGMGSVIDSVVQDSCIITGFGYVEEPATTT